MNDPDRLTREEIISRLRAASQRSKLKSKPPAPTAAEKAEARFAGKSSNGAAIMQDAIAANTEAETWLQKEIRRLEQAAREFEEEQDRLAKDPARSNHQNTAYRRTIAQTPQGHARYYSAGEAIRATHDAQIALNRYASFSVNPQDSDADLHLSPEQQIWK